MGGELRKEQILEGLFSDAIISADAIPIGDDGARKLKESLASVDVSGILSAVGAILSGLTASQIVETDGSKQLVSAAKGTAYNKNFGTGAGEVAEGNAVATIALDNLASVAINASLISDTDNTDDLGTALLRWKDIYAATLNTGETAANTLILRARDVDGAAWVDFITLTANNTPTCDLSVQVTRGGNTILDDTSTVSALTTVGALISGSIVPGFGNIDVGTQQVQCGTLTIKGASPQFLALFTADVDPPFQLRPVSHDNINYAFDVWWNGSNWISSSPNGNVVWIKGTNSFAFNYQTGVAKGSTIASFLNAWQVDLSTGYVGFGAPATEKVDVTGNVKSSGSIINGKQVVKRTATGALDYNPSALTSDYLIAVDNTAAPRNVIISTEDIQSGSTANPRVFVIKDESGGAATNNITVSGETGNIDGASNAVIAQNYASITVYADGTNLFIM